MPSTSRMHRLLMARGDIIDRLIQVKQTQEVGSAFRPAREADMMRRLVERHRGILPLDTVESIWRVIISTFTYVQAPFSVHADISVGESAMRDSARFHFGFTVPYVSHFSASAAVEAVAKSKGDLALVSGHLQPHAVVDHAGGRTARRRSSRGCRFVERADHPAALPVFVVSRVADSAMVTEVETWSVRVSGWNAEIARALSPLAEIVAVPDTAFDGAALSGVDRGPDRPGKDQAGPDRGRRLGALIGSRRQPCNALYGAPERGRPNPERPPRLSGVEDVPPRAESRHSRYCALHARQEPGAGAGPQGVQAVGQRDAVRALAEGDRGLQGTRRRISRTIRKAPRGCCARRSAAPSGSIPTASSAAPAPTKSSTCSRTPISAMATRRSPPPTAFWSTRSRPWPTAPATSSRPRPISPPTSTRS